MDIKERIEHIMKTEGLNSSNLADIINVQRSTISHYISGRNKPGLDFIQKILSKFKNINAEWLILGKGEMYKHIISANKSEPDLFTNSGDIQDNNQEKIKYAQNKPLNEPEINTKNEALNPEKQQDKNRKIEQIVVFFSDKSFETYKPN